MKNKLFLALGALALCAVAFSATISTIPALPDVSGGVFTQANHDQINTNSTLANTNFTNVNAQLATLAGQGGAAAPAACGATCSPAGGQLVLLGTAAGSTVTLPAATGTGNVIRLRVTVTTTSAADKVLLTTVTDVITGNALGWTGSTPIVFSGSAGTYHSLQMPFTGSQPSGGFIGDTVACTDIASAKWSCDVFYQGGTTPTTPYSTATT